MELTEDDVLQILKLIDESSFDYFQLEVGELKITVSKGDYVPAALAQAATPPSPTQTAGLSPIVQAPAPSKQSATKTDSPAAAASGEPEEDGLIPVTAPLLGTFYVAPEPGAPPFVQGGAAVEEETTVGLIEVMKVFNSVRAGVRGVIAKVLVQNGQFVEYGQKLFLVKPTDGSVDSRRSG